MNFNINDRQVWVTFTKTTLVNNSFYENEISEADIRLLSADNEWWANFVPKYLAERNLALTTNWFDEQQRQNWSRYGHSNNDLLFSDGKITDLKTRVDMSEFPDLFGNIRIFAISTQIPREGAAEICLHLHRDA